MVFRTLAAEGQHDPRLAARLREEHLTHQRIRYRQPLDRALQRGDLPAETDLDTLVDRLVGPLYYRALVTGQEISEVFVARLVITSEQLSPACDINALAYPAYAMSGYV